MWSVLTLAAVTDIVPSYASKMGMSCVHCGHWRELDNFGITENALATRRLRLLPGSSADVAAWLEGKAPELGTRATKFILRKDLRKLSRDTNRWPSWQPTLHWVLQLVK
ncbi:uncharacterized protein SCHCODRAFT_02723478 [Schizophyllum commune H4-8]|nr:uncharacterized protein SCHCODRAFT_02723478 [Schizophyllum commune H4-8]KAI5895917.1 hypothetical protein SCHCODRAFT_02723478 [Schizophyllum commune H4-8]